LIFVAIARSVTGGPPNAVDARAERHLFDRFTRFAVFFTMAGYGSGVLVAFALATVATLIWMPDRTIAVLPLLAAQSLSQYAIDGLKARYGRARPQNWLYRQELNAAYPSGHAATAVVTYAGLFLLLIGGTHDANAQAVLACAAIVFVAGIGWSRVALGAHYLSDVIAGYALGTATLLLTVAASRAAGLPLP
jgi:undecaprenyl-diphosphatase